MDSGLAAFAAIRNDDAGRPDMTRDWANRFRLSAGAPYNPAAESAACWRSATRSIEKCSIASLNSR